MLFHYQVNSNFLFCFSLKILFANSQGRNNGHLNEYSFSNTEITVKHSCMNV